MIKNLSLRSKIIVGSVSAILIPVLFAGIITYSKLSNSILEIYREKAYQLAIDMSNLISTIMEQELKFARSMAVDPEVVNALNRNDYQNASREIKSILNSLGADYRTFFIMDSKGIIRSEVTYPEQIGLDLSDRDYFIRAKKGISSIGGPVIARGPKHSRIAGTVVILVCSPIHTSRGFSGALTTVFDADYFIKKISTLRVGKTGYPFIINESGVVLFFLSTCR
jgi:methyl-accepting chemotaxis protein